MLKNYTPPPSKSSSYAEIFATDFCGYTLSNEICLFETLLLGLSVQVFLVSW